MSGPGPVLHVWLLLLWTVPAVAAAQTADAYADPVARQLVERARERRGVTDQSIAEYRALSTERISVLHRLLRRERLLFRRETAARVHWRREGDIEIAVLGAREVVPVAKGGAQIPADLADYMPHIAFDPLDSEFLLRFDTTFIRHPLAPGAERHYRYAAGDSLTLRLPDGREVKLRELRITPRRRDPDLIVGSFWLHHETHAVVQAAFRLARPRSVAEDEEGFTPGFVRSIRFDFSHFALDYGLWDFRWWLPRSVVVEGVLELGAFGTMPMQYERSYSDYDVIADSTRATTAAVESDSARVRCRRRTRFAMSINVGPETPDSVRTDSARVAVRERSAERRRTAPSDSANAECQDRYVVTVPDSIDNLLVSELLPASIYDESPLLTEAELAQLADRVRSLPLPMWQVGTAALEFGPSGSGLLRYNRVEGLGIGARGRVDFGRVQGALELGYGLADEWPKAQADLVLNRPTRTLTLSGYRRLSATDPAMRPFSFSSSLTALVLGRDDALFYRAAGASALLRPAAAETPWYELRLYAERQSATSRNTDFSIPHLLDDAHRFRRNIVADRAAQYGSELTLRGGYGINPDALRLGVQLDVRAETGTFEFARPSLTLRANLPPLGPLAPALEAAAGSTFGTSPAQSRWYLGGTHTLRGYNVLAAEGEAFWRGRAELATSLPLVRLALFSDVGWAGAAAGDAWRTTRPLLSAGAGLSVLDGVVRFDVARALRSPTGWRVHFYLDGLL